MGRYGLLGEKLGHSFSKEIHGKLADYEYQLIELTPEQLPAFLERREFAAINVTQPYKQTVMDYLDWVSDIAGRIGAVNTVVNRQGKLYGYNTDYHGMIALIRRIGVSLQGKKVLVLGTGGTCKTACVVAADLGAAQVITVSRNRSAQHIDYSDAARLHRDADVIINTTPVGMYPDCQGTPIDLQAFDRLSGVIDAVYNPLRTDLVLDAQAKGIPAEGGLYMLVMQAVVAAEKFLDREIPRSTADSIFSSVLAAKENIVLTGMPGSGKTTVGKLLKPEGYTFVDTDQQIEKQCGCTIRELIAAKGEDCFRDLETQVIREVSRESGRIIATGGGAILKEENVRALKRNGTLFFLDAPLCRLRPTDARPLSDTEDKLAALYAQRLPIYKSTADVIVPALENAGQEAQYILAKRRELIL